VQAAQRNGGLPGMFGAAPHRGHQPRAAGDGLASRLGIDQTNEQAPPVVDQRHRSCGQLAAMQIMGGEPAPAPLVLQLVEGVLGICSVTIELAALDPGRSQIKSVIRPVLTWK
jgi:hypothetical protein